MKKIYVGKTDPITLIIEKIIKSSEKDIVLYVPRDSVSFGVRNNFKLLKREADAGDKTVSFESVDDDVLELAQAFDMKALNPFFGKKKFVTDIVIKKPGTVKLKEDEEEKSDLEANIKIKEKDNTHNSILNSKQESSGLWGTEPKAEEKPKTKATLSIKIIRWLALVVVVGFFGWLAFFVLPEADISMTFKEIPWNFNGTIIVSASRSSVAATDKSIQLPGQVFTNPGNLQASYTASGNQHVERKATGTITIYNEYSSEKQSLLAGTRFSAPDGKIFKTNTKITVPGAKIVNGKISSSQIDVSVTAEKAGADYNIPPTSKFRIPGFQGKPKYNAFYGISSDPMTGGIVGDIKVPTKDDISKAEVDIKNTLESNLRGQTSIKVPDDVKVFPKAYSFQVTKETISKEAGDDGKFTILMSGELKAIGFKESDLLGAFASQVAAQSDVDLTLHNSSLQQSDAGYGDPSLDLKNGNMSFNMDFKSNWVRAFDVNDFKNKAAGKSKTDITTTIYGMPGFVSGEVSFWPIWVFKSPHDTSKIVVDVSYVL
jgi:hypothetical protein